MRVVRIQAKQGHAVPSSWQASRGPFPPELYREPKNEVDFTEFDDMGQEVHEGATAQNNFKEPKWFKCRLCEDIVSEYQLDSHECQESAEEDVDSTA